MYRYKRFYKKKTIPINIKCTRRKQFVLTLFFCHLHFYVSQFLMYQKISIYGSLYNVSIKHQSPHSYSQSHVSQRTRKKTFVQKRIAFFIFYENFYTEKSDKCLFCYNKEFYKKILFTTLMNMQVQYHVIKCIQVFAIINLSKTTLLQQVNIYFNFFFN